MRADASKNDQDESLGLGQTSDSDESLGIDGLYRGRADILVRHFAERTRDFEEAADIVQEAFARFATLNAKRRAAFARPDSYIYRICINLFRDQRRQRAVHDRHWSQLARIPCDTTHDPIANLETRDTLRRLEDALGQLRPKTRQIFLARRLDGMTYGEIAEQLSISVKAVEKHMAKAVAQLDRMLERR